MSNQVLCNRMRKREPVCTGCNVLSILGAKLRENQSVDEAARIVSQQYCPTGSGGIEPRIIGLIANSNSGETTQRSIW